MVLLGGLGLKLVNPLWGCEGTARRAPTGNCVEASPCPKRAKLGITLTMASLCSHKLLT